MTEKEKFAYKAFDEGRPVEYLIMHGISETWARRLRDRWRKAHPGAPRQNWRATIKALEAKGMSEEEIHEWTGYSIETIRSIKPPKPVRCVDVPPEFRLETPIENRNAKLCRSCIYRADDTIVHGKPVCGYMCVTGHRRGCPAEMCDRYQKGKRIREKAFAYH